MWIVTYTLENRAKIEMFTLQFYFMRTTQSRKNMTK